MDHGRQQGRDALPHPSNMNTPTLPHSPPDSARSRRSQRMSSPGGGELMGLTLPRNRSISLDWHRSNLDDVNHRTNASAAGIVRDGRSTHENDNLNYQLANEGHHELLTLETIPSDEMTPLPLSPRRPFSPMRRPRTRAASHEIILNINDAIPRYDNDLAERIGSITDEDVRSFSMTPDRQSSGGGRGRTNSSCPRSPQVGNAVVVTAVLPLSPLHMQAEINGRGEDDRGGIGRGRANTCPPGALEENFELNSTEESDRETSMETPRPVSASSPSRPSILPSGMSTPTRRSHSAMTPLPMSPSHSSSNNHNIAPTPSIISSPTTPRPPRPHCIFRHQNLIRSLMLLSLYMTLSYTWHHDLRHRYHSSEINAGLSDYWNGAGRLLDDGVDDVKSKFVFEGEKKKRRPALSHARSLDSMVRKVERRRAESESGSIVSKVVWWLVCMGFMLPIVEVGWGEVRRHVRLRRWRRRHSSSVRDL